MELLKPIHLERQWRTSWSEGFNWGILGAFTSLEEAQKGLERVRNEQSLRNRMARIVDSRTSETLWEGKVEPKLPQWLIKEMLINEMAKEAA